MGAVGTVTVKPPSTAVALEEYVSEGSHSGLLDNSRSKDWSGNRNESGVDLRLAICRLDDGTWSQERDGRSDRDVAILRRREERWESLDGKLGVARWLADDEWGSKCVHLIQREGDIKGRREGALAERGPDVRRVTRLDRQDGPGGGQVSRAHNLGGGTEVGTDTDALEDRRQLNEALGIGSRETVSGFGHGCSTCGLESTREESNVSRLVRRDLFQVVVERRVKAGFGEVVLRVVRQTVSVELIFQVFQRQGIVQDIGVSDLRRRLSDGLQTIEPFSNLSSTSLFCRGLTCWSTGREWRRPEQQKLRQTRSSSFSQYNVQSFVLTIKRC